MPRNKNTAYRGDPAGVGDIKENSLNRTDRVSPDEEIARGQEMMKARGDKHKPLEERSATRHTERDAIPK